MRHRAQLSAIALTCALALVGCGQQTSHDAVSTGTAASDSTASDTDADGSSVGPGTSIPDDFPLSAGMTAPEDEIPTSRTGTGLRDLELCGTAPLRGLGLRDRMVADNSGGEALDTRELVLMGSPEEATQLARAFTDLPTDCEAPSVKQDFETLTQVRGSAFARPAPAVTLLQTYELRGEPVPGTMVVHVVPVGAALLVTVTYGEWADDALDAGIAETADAVRRTVAALAAFDDGTATSTEDSEPVESDPVESETEPAGPTQVPDGFPLDAGLPEDGGDFEVEEPSGDGEGVGELEMCGRVVWPIGGTAGGTRRLATSVLGPEYFDGRELLVHADAQVASTAMTAIRQAAQDCRTSGNQVWTVLDRDTGYDTVTMGLSYTDGLGSSVFQATRVGSARLMVQTYGEGSIDSLDTQADEVTATTMQVVAAMCVFTRTGC